MKEMIICRHAKSSWQNSKLKDHERPLKTRGKKDSKRIGKFLRRANLLPELILSSTSERSRQTVRFFLKTAKYKPEIDYIRAFYMGSVSDIFHDLCQISNDISRVMVVGHNPTLEEMISILTSSKDLNLKLPTTGLAYLTLESRQWSGLKKGHAHLNWMVTPKILKKIF